VRTFGRCIPSWLASKNPSAAAAALEKELVEPDRLQDGTAIQGGLVSQQLISEKVHRFFRHFPVCRNRRP